MAGASDISYGRRLSDLAAARGDETALVSVAEDGSERVVSWRLLNDRAVQVARLLVAQGVKVGDRVALQLRNSPEHFFASFGSWKAGATVYRCAGISRRGSSGGFWR